MTPLKPRIAVTFGDPAGIGPELVARQLSRPETFANADILLISDERELNESMLAAGISFQWSSTSRAGLPRLVGTPHTREAQQFVKGEPSREGGLWALGTLRTALGMAKAGEVDAILFAPLNKTSLHLAGMTQFDEMGWFESVLADGSTASELNILPTLVTGRVTSHLPLSEVASNITFDRVVSRGLLLVDVLRRRGIAEPRIGVAALNPHAGENGLFGSQETEIIAPAVKELSHRGINATGPFPSDTIFVRAVKGEFDGILTMYHDQGQIAVKLLGFEEGVTLAGGLSVPICTPAHGTAFGLVGTGLASTGAYEHAFATAISLGTPPSLDSSSDRPLTN